MILGFYKLDEKCENDRGLCQNFPLHPDEHKQSAYLSEKGGRVGNVSTGPDPA